MELYKKYRPRRFGDMVGNRSVLKSLAGMLKSGNLPHVLLFHGPSGCGKTTLARIVQERLGCHELDKVELNSSSFRGIDSIRDLQRLSTLCPIGKARVWILDEVHKLTSDAQHAALKLLEDTPSHVYFFLCTTNPEKLIRPIRTRCCEIPVQSLDRKELGALLERVGKEEDMELNDGQRDLLIDNAAGSARSLLVLLDRLRHLPSEVWDKAVSNDSEEIPGVIDLCRALLAKRPWRDVATILRGIEAEPESVRWAVLGYAKAVLLKSAKPQAYLMIQCFSEPFYNTKVAGLVGSAWEVINGE